MGLVGNIFTVLLIGYLGYSAYEIGSLWFPIQNLYFNVEDMRFRLWQLYHARIQVRREIWNSIEWVNSEPFFSKTNVDLNQPFDELVKVPWPVSKRSDATNLHLAVTAYPAGRPAKALMSEDIKTSLYATYELIKFMPSSYQKKKFLLNSEGDASKEDLKRSKETEENSGKDVPHFKTIMKLRLVNDERSYSPESIPGELRWTFMDGSRRQYRPFFYADELHVYRHDLVPVTALNSSSDPSVHVTFSPTSIGAYRLLMQLQGTINLMKSQFGLGDKDTEQVLMIFSPDNIYRLILTGVVSMLHTLFAFLAFKNDVGFWRGREDLAGLSRRSIIGHAICSVIIFLFLYDSPGTSWLVLGTMFVSTLIDLWKVSKVLRISNSAHKNSSDENETDLHDSQGMYYLSMVLYPLVIGWALYSLYANAHRSWWSCYAFGFLMMTPQIFINYKLKSVAHLPWRAMSYKVFNTFVDDIFAFLIEMPTIHRLATLRDDLVFFIYLYQRWIYPVDKKRANEYGYAAEETKPSNAPSTTPSTPSPPTEDKLKTE